MGLENEWQPRPRGVIKIDSDSTQQPILQRRIAYLNGMIAARYNMQNPLWSKFGEKLAIPYDSFSYEGNLRILESPLIIGFTGGRKTNAREKEIMGLVVGTLAQGRKDIGEFCIMTGLAEGTDSDVTNGSLYYKIPTIAMLPSQVSDRNSIRQIGLAKRIIENDGLLLSPFVANNNLDDKRGMFFHYRNRAITGLADVLIVGPGDMDGGTAKTIRLAAFTGTPIIFIRAEDDPNKENYRNGAQEAFFEEYGIQTIATTENKNLETGAFPGSIEGGGGRTPNRLTPIALLRSTGGLVDQVKFLATQKHIPNPRSGY